MSIESREEGEVGNDRVLVNVDENSFFFFHNFVLRDIVSLDRLRSNRILFFCRSFRVQNIGEGRGREEGVGGEGRKEVSLARRWMIIWKSGGGREGV